MNNKKWSLKQKLSTNQLTVGTWLQIPSLHIASIVAKCGFEWVVIDMEHGSIGLETVPGMVSAILAAESIPLVRVAHNDPCAIKQALDAGALGIIVPMVNSVADAKRAVQSCYYPPRGIRGVGFSFANSFGKDFGSYIQEFNQQVVVVLQIEHIDAIQDIDAILAIPGVDAVMVGPYDLSASMGKVGLFQDEAYLDALQKVRVAAQSNDVVAGVHVVKPFMADLKNQIDAGNRFIAFGTDGAFLYTQCESLVDQIRQIQ